MNGVTSPNSQGIGFLLINVYKLKTEMSANIAEQENNIKISSNTPLAGKNPPLHTRQATVPNNNNNQRTYNSILNTLTTSFEKQSYASKPPC